MSDDAIDTLRLALLALLPTDGSPVTVAALAAAARVAPGQVTGALFDEWFAGRINFDLRADAYSAIPKGNAS